MRVRDCKTDADVEEFFREMQSFTKPVEPKTQEEEEEDAENPDVDFDDVSEASLDLNLLEVIKSEFNES
jgi:hypothetical protein